VRVATVPSIEEATPYARGLYRSLKAASTEVREAKFNFNQYVRKTATGQIEVWRLPAWQTDGTLVYGGELCQTLDATGATVLDTRFMSSGFHAVTPDRRVDLWVNNEDSDIASVGNIFLILAYGDQFKSVLVRGRRFVTSLCKTKDTESWVHVERDESDKK
jgi:hypothetical protein